MSSETDDMKNVSISVIKVNDSKDTTNSGDDNNLSVATIDESQLIGTSFTDSDQNLTLDEEALLKSPEISFLKYTDLEQHSVIKEDENLIQHSHSIAENCTVENSAVEEYFEHENDMVANVSQVKVNPRGIEDLALEECISTNKNLGCLGTEVDNNPGDLAVEIVTGTGAESKLYLQSKNVSPKIFNNIESEVINLTPESDMEVDPTADKQANSEEKLDAEVIFRNEQKTENDIITETERENTTQDIITEKTDNVKNIIPVQSNENSENLQSKIPAIENAINVNMSINVEEEVAPTSTSGNLIRDLTESENKDAEAAKAEEETADIKVNTEVETIEEKEETGAIREHCEITSAMQISSGPEVKLSEINLIHHIKNIQFKDNKIGIVTQNENGPCPLVAIINVLLLKHQMTLPALCEIISASKLMEYIGNTILENIPKNLSGEARLNYEQNMHDAMAVLPKLQTGLDVNVRFTGVRDFEYTPECIIFDLLRIPLYHGWLVDPQTPEIVAAIGNASYNQIVEKAISQKCSDNADSITEALIIENFLERTASQLTYHGLSELNSATSEQEIGVLFRNNHFSTIYKHGNELLQLVTDQGFLNESSVVWETLGSIDGDGQFVDGHFRTVPPKPECTTGATSSTESSLLTAEQQIDQDFLVALSLQDQPETPEEELANPATMTNDKSTQEFLDAKLARELQREEERRAAEAEANRGATAQPSRPAETPQAKKKDGCAIL